MYIFTTASDGQVVSGCEMPHNRIIICIPVVMIYLCYDGKSLIGLKRNNGCP